VEFPDLSPYTCRKPLIPMRSVGWLGPKLGLQGNGSQQLEDSAKARLHEASWGLVSMTLGWYECDFCPAGARFQGNGEYRYYARRGEVYGAPMMILHYVDEHGYCPPAEFLTDLGQEGDLEWDWRADRLAEVALDTSEDPENREDAFSDIAHWREPRALEVLRQVARDEVMISASGHQLGQTIGHFVGCDFAGDLLSEDFHIEVRQSIPGAQGIWRNKGPY
jgi:hypothetical protein